MLEAISFKIKISADYDETVCAIGSLIQNVEKLLAQPGWSASALRQVVKSAELLEALKTLFDKILSHCQWLSSATYMSSDFYFFWFI